MSVESLAIALHHSRATSTAKLVLLGIANHDGDGGAWPSVATLAKYANCHPRNAQRGIDKLVELGEIARHLNAGGTFATPNHMRPNRYTFTLTCPPACDRSSAHRIKPAKPVDNSQPDPLAPAPPPGASATPPPGASATRTTLRTELRNNAQRETYVTYSAPSSVDECIECSGEVFIDEPAAFALELCPRCYHSVPVRLRREREVYA